MAENTKVVLSRKQLFEVGDTIRQHCRVDEQGFATYDSGWSDERILQQFSIKFTITLGNVERLRRDIVGELPKRVRKYEMQEEIALLRRRLFLLEQWATKRKHDAFKPEIIMPSK